MHDVRELVNNSTLLFQFIINKYSYKYYLEYLNLSERKRKLFFFSPGKVSVRIEKAPRKKNWLVNCILKVCVCVFQFAVLWSKKDSVDRCMVLKRFSEIQSPRLFFQKFGSWKEKKNVKIYFYILLTVYCRKNMH